MTEAKDFIESFLQHMLPSNDGGSGRSTYDPIKAHQYYMRTRHLKGRKKGKAQNANQNDYKYTGKVDPRAYRTADGSPLPKRGKRMEEDQTPAVSPNGAKLVSYDGKGLGKAVYSDGRVYDPKVGWVKRSPQERKAFEATKSRTRRVQQATTKLTRLRESIKSIKNPSVRTEMQRRLRAAEAKLKKLQS